MLLPWFSSFRDKDRRRRTLRRKGREPLGRDLPFQTPLGPCLLGGGPVSHHPGSGREDRGEGPGDRSPAPSCIVSGESPTSRKHVDPDYPRTSRPGRTLYGTRGEGVETTVGTGDLKRTRGTLVDVTFILGEKDSADTEVESLRKKWVSIVIPTGSPGRGDKTCRVGVGEGVSEDGQSDSVPLSPFSTIRAKLLV